MAQRLTACSVLKVAHVLSVLSSRHKVDVRPVGGDLFLAHWTAIAEMTNADKSPSEVADRVADLVRAGGRRGPVPATYEVDQETFSVVRVHLFCTDECRADFAVPAGLAPAYGMVERAWVAEGRTCARCGRKITKPGKAEEK